MQGAHTVTDYNKDYWDSIVWGPNFSWNQGEEWMSMFIKEMVWLFIEAQCAPAYRLGKETYAL